jgi:predicted peptidase
MTTIPCAAAVLLALFAGLPQGDSPMPGLQQPQVFEKEVMITLKYLLYLPEDFGKEPGKKWPVILFLHGAGERGDNLELVKKHGPPKRISEGRKFPFIVVSPQCPANDWWSTEKLFHLLDEIESKYEVDRGRVYVTGLSMGGFASWNMGMEQPERIAAIAPICGGGEPVLAWRYRSLPIWAFHGAKDTVVPLRRSEEMVEAVQKAGGDVKLTVYAEAEHDSWTETYDNPDLYDWFLSHERKGR